MAHEALEDLPEPTFELDFALDTPLPDPLAQAHTTSEPTLEPQPASASTSALAPELALPLPPIPRFQPQPPPALPSSLSPLPAPADSVDTPFSAPLVEEEQSAPEPALTPAPAPAPAPVLDPTPALDPQPSLQPEPPSSAEPTPHEQPPLSPTLADDGADSPPGDALGEDWGNAQQNHAINDGHDSGLEPSLPHEDWHTGIDTDTDTDAHTAPRLEDDAHLPSFMRQAQRQARQQERWSHPWLRFGSGMLLVLLPLALVVQILLYQRNSLAAHVPLLRPWLSGACYLAGCEVQAPRSIGDLVVSGSSFTAGAGAAPGQPQPYRLGLSIANQANTMVAMPALELTLTDAQDQVLARKILPLSALGAPPHIGSRAEWSTTLPLQVQELPQPIAGYRVLLFYP